MEEQPARRDEVPRHRFRRKKCTHVFILLAGKLQRLKLLRKRRDHPDQGLRSKTWSQRGKNKYAVLNFSYIYMLAGGAEK